MLNWYFKTLFKSFSFEITHKIALRCPYFCDLPRFCVLAPEFNWSCRDLIIQSFPIVQNIYNLLWSCGPGTWLELDLDRFNCSKLKLVNLFFKLFLASNDLAIFCDLVLWLHLDLSIIDTKKVARRWKLDLSSITGNCNQLFLPRCPLFNDGAALVIILEEMRGEIVNAQS